MRKFKKYVYSSKSFEDCLETTAIVADKNNKDFIIEVDTNTNGYNGYLLVSYENL